MKFITSHLIKFVVLAMAWTLVFRFGLYYSIQNKMFILAVLSSVFYGIGMFFLGKYFGKKDFRFLPIYDIGFRYHLTTYLSYNLVTFLWSEFFVPLNRFETGLFSTIVYWGIGLFIHFLFFIYFRYFTKQSIKGLDKDNLFE